MSKQTYPYPPDEFDNVEPGSVPVQAHAARRTGWSKTWPFIAVIVIVCLLAIASVFVVSWWRNSANTDVPTVAQQTTTSAPAAPSVTTSAPVTSTQTQSPTPSATTSATASVSKTLSIEVLNGTGRTGLAAATASKLVNLGWTNAAARSNIPTPGQYSAVYYANSADAAAAREVASSLGISQVQQNSLYTAARVAIVLRSDYTG